MEIGLDPLSISGTTILADPELEIIDRLSEALTEAGFRADRIDVANFYAALKHRPMAILVGPAAGGKAALVRCLADILAGDRGLQKQIAPGHAWYADGHPANTVLIGMHARLITEKLLDIIEEAAQPRNSRQVFVAGLTHISPAELLNCFTEVAYQLQHNAIMRIGDAHLSAPISFPPNLLLIGTMDTSDFNWWDEDLLCGATVIEWRADVVAPKHARCGDLHELGGAFLHSSLRNAPRAYEKLVSVVSGFRQPLKTIMSVRAILLEHRVELPPTLLNQVILFLANVWSQKGIGLFDLCTSRNLAIASDLALAQLVLPRNLKEIRSSEILQRELDSILDERLPRSSAFLRKQCEGTALRAPKGV